MEFIEMVKWALLFNYAAFSIVAFVEFKEGDYKQALLSVAICACLILAIFLI